jgi:hypothetical protein
MSLSGIAAAGASTKHRERRLGNQSLDMTAGPGQVKGTLNRTAVLNATDSHPVAPRHAKPRLTESDWQQVAELVVSSHRE